MDYFHILFPELAPTEMLMMTASQEPGMLDGEYIFFETYCTNPDCLCQEVVIQVMLFQKDKLSNAKGMGRTAAEIKYSWSQPLSTQNPKFTSESGNTELSRGVLKLLREHLAGEPTYVSRLEKHYNMMKKEGKAQWGYMATSPTVYKDAQPNRNEPCSCGSGKKYKKCCLQKTKK
jgi:hypothetical protein